MDFRKKTLLFLVIWILIISVLPLINSKEANSTFLYVDEDGSKDYISIQHAIENASEKDTIYVYNGTYNEAIVIEKSICLIGENKENTIILGGNGPIVERDRFIYTNNPKNSTCLIDIKSDNVTIKGFRIKNSTFFDIVKVQWYYSSRACYPTNYIFQHSDIGIGINVSSNNCLIKNNIIEMNGADGINLKNSEKNFIENNIIKNNSLCGIYLMNSSKNHIFRNNISYNGLGISFVNFSFNNTFYHNNFINNSRNHVLNDENNSFYNKEYEQGNYWDDYNGTDSDHNGIGDRPYLLPSEENQDKYPLIYPYKGEIIKEQYIDIGVIVKTLILGVVLSIFLLLPIAYYWRKKYFK